MTRQRQGFGDASTAQPVPERDGARSISFLLFDTGVRLVVYAPVDVADPLLCALRDRCLFFETALSRTRVDSDISRAHVAAPRSVRIQRETADLLRLALVYCEKSRGLFDVTMGTLTSLWDFHAQRVPDPAVLAYACAHVGWERIKLGVDADGWPTLAICDPETVLDLGGVAKGYIADDLVRCARAHSVSRFAFDLGGNIALAGGRPPSANADPLSAGGESWRVGIQDPRCPERNCAVVHLASGSVVTSGVGERSFTKEGFFYHHILDPKTGMPAQSDALSATIVAARSLDCDGYSTTAFMLGCEEGSAFVEELSGVEAVFVGCDGRIRWTSGLAGRLEVIGDVSAANG